MCFQSDLSNLLLVFHLANCALSAKPGGPLRLLSEEVCRGKVDVDFI